MLSSEFTHGLLSVPWHTTLVTDSCSDRSFLVKWSVLHKIKCEPFLLVQSPPAIGERQYAPLSIGDRGHW